MVSILDISSQGIYRKKIHKFGISSSGQPFFDVHNIIMPVKNMLRGYEVRKCYTIVPLYSEIKRRNGPNQEGF